MVRLQKAGLRTSNPTEILLYYSPLLNTAKKKELKLYFLLLKAVFSVKDFIGNKDYKKVRTFNVDLKITPSQRKLIVNFKDGEHLYGTSHSYGRYKVGFFVYPIDPKDNSERIFVIHKAIESVRLMKIDQNGDIIKGWVEECQPERESFILFPLIEYSKEERIEIKFSSLKAVFFVKDFTGDKNYKKVRTFNVDLKITPQYFL